VHPWPLDAESSIYSGCIPGSSLRKQPSPRAVNYTHLESIKEKSGPYALKRAGRIRQFEDMIIKEV